MPFIILPYWARKRIGKTNLSLLLSLSLLIIFGLSSVASAEDNKKECHYHKGIETVVIPCNKTIIKPEFSTEMELWFQKLENDIADIMEESIISNKCKTAISSSLVWLERGWKQREISKKELAVLAVKKECDV